ncbi:hypothetical protein [Haloferula sp. BvORR071]|nr:hypothetical protein [Haloferula sp. BvORR071]
MLVEVLSGGKAESIYIRGSQLGERAKESPEILIKGALGRTKD